MLITQIFTVKIPPFSFSGVAESLGYDGLIETISCDMNLVGMRAAMSPV
jgi:hypothetical protein